VPVKSRETPCAPAEVENREQQEEKSMKKSKHLILAAVALAISAVLLLPAPAAKAQIGGCTSCDSYSWLALCVRDDTSPWASCRIIERCYFFGQVCVDTCVFSSYCRQRPG
jgi:hypothetical protein